MALSVHFAYTPTDDSIAHLRERLEDDIKTTFGTDSPENANYHILISGRPSVELLDASPNLNTLLIPFAGVPAVTKERMADYPQIAIHNLHHNAPPTAEMALALLMAVARNLIPSDRDFRQH
ncbi:MAG: hydroxyacid dehydrogenase, partial [Chloroflexota bacterium]